jgi:hypothetical protein
VTKPSINLETARAAREAASLVDQIRPLLAHQSANAVGAALGELCAIFIASHAPELRNEQRKMLVRLIDDLTPVVIGEMIEQGRVTETWQ